MLTVEDIAKIVLIISCTVLVLAGILFEEKLAAWEERHIPKLRRFFVGLGYGFLELLDKTLDGVAWIIAQPIRIIKRSKRSR